ncbi:DUF3169 family protein [Halonatronum saccharophilum]|uniref:DUF3169 family protein n=1 Tax=Halonatronum saccharophilum TaxID=150060 RepID=UPI0004B72592|nr:DUF3169 family protein [Halonatronum saccharophilum]
MSSKKKYFLFLISIILGSGIFGFLVGYFEDNISGEGLEILSFLGDLTMRIGVFGGLLLISIIFYLFFGVNKQLKNISSEGEKDIIKNKIDIISILFLIVTVSFLVVLSLKDRSKVFSYSLDGAIILLIFLPFVIIIEKKLINCSNKITHHRKLSYFDTENDKFKNFDEGEKWIAANSAYKTLGIMDIIFGVVWILSLGLTDLFSLPRLSTMIIVLLWGIQKFIYVYQVYKKENSIELES